MWWGFSYRVEVSLVELVHSSLQLAALTLPLLKVSDWLHGGTLPRGGAGVVVHIIDPAPVVNSALPAGEMDDTINIDTQMQSQRFAYNLTLTHIIENN